MRKIRQFLMTLVLLCGALTSWAAPYSGTPSATLYKITASNYINYGFTAENWQAFENYYAIASAEDLYCFADSVNSGSTSINAVLTADIVVNASVLNASGNFIGTSTYKWTPIGTYSKKFNGTFDGNSHTISGLCFENTTAHDYPDGGNNVGLIGYASGATIKNVGVVDSYIKGVGSVGGICGKDYSNSTTTTITNCYNTGTILGSSYSVGGICGDGHSSNTTIITNCYNTGKVSNSKNDLYTYVGGICGRDGTLTNCYNTGTVSGFGYVGGICGFCYSSTTTITNCYNTGTVSGSGSGSVGGICGKGGTQTNCYNTGTVSGSDYYVGGICGQYGTQTNCYNTGTVSCSGSHSCIGGICGQYGTQTNCYNTGTVSGSSSSVGGICGSRGTLTNCYYLADCGSKNTLGVSATAEEFASGKITYLLNNQKSYDPIVWYQTLDDDALPTLNANHQKVYAPYPCFCRDEFANTPIVQEHGACDALGLCSVCGKYGIAATLIESEEQALNDFSLTAEYVGYYAIRNAAQLYWFAQLVNEGETTAKAILTANIAVNTTVLNNDGTLNGTPTYSWTPIGTSINNFKGIFDGNGHTISGLYFSNITNKGYPNGGNYVGLIGYANEATIKNVGVIDSYIRGYQYAGGICSYGSNTTITNCYNTGTISGSFSNVGGICGYGSNTTITNCYNTGTISGSSDIGGICGNGGTQTNCYNTGMVSGSSEYVGGICGCSGTITNCYNTGTVSGSSSVGGICAAYGTQTNCYNTGTVSGSSSVGGICGFNGGQTNCYNTGMVKGSSYGVGGICGRYGTQTNCYYLAGCAKDGNNTVQYGVGNATTEQTTADVTGNTISATAEEFAGGKIGYLLNQNNNVWYQNLFEDASPVLNTAHNSITGYFEVEDNVSTVVGDMILVTDYEVAAGKTLSVPAGASLTTTGEAVINNNGIIIVNGNGTISGNDLEGSGSFLFNDLIGETDFVLNTTSYTYKGSAYTLESGIDFDISHTIFGKEFVFGGSYTATYSNNLNVGTATVTLTNNADAENVVSRQFTISAKEIEIDWNTDAIIYNGTAQVPSATAASSSLCGSDVCNITVTGAQTNAGTGYTATASALDNANYKLPEAVTKEFAIGKATPTYTLPENLAIKCGQSLADITLPSGFTIENTNAELVIGENTVTVTFTPEDADNYEVVTGIEVKLTKSHAVVTDAAVAATCTETGLTEGSHCSVCHTVLVAQEVIPAGHTAGEAVAENYKAPTCTLAGSVDSVVYCSVCKEELSRKTVVIDSLGHKADSVLFENIKSATCTEAGSYDSVVYCSVCKVEVSRTTITTPANGHKADSVVIENIVVATHTATGSYDSVVYCSVCKAEISRKTIEVAMTDIISVAVSKMPNKLTYKVGEKLDVTGGKLKVTFSDSTSIEVDILAVMVSGFDATVAGKQSLTITYTDGGKTYTATFDIEVEEEESTAVAEEAAAAVSIYAFDNTIVVEAAEALTGEIAVFDINGRMIAKALAAGTRTEIQMPNAGIYIVKAGAAAKRIVIK